MNIEDTKYELSEKPQARYRPDEGGSAIPLSTQPADGFGERFFQRIAVAWPKILLAGFVAGATSLVAFTGYRYFTPMPVTFSNAIVVTMADVEKGRYPNGSPYSATDLRSAPVLESVYSANQVDKYGVNLATFQGYVSVANVPQI